MKWRLSRLAAKAMWPRDPAWTLARALVGSVSVHAVLAWLFFSHQAPRPAPGGPSSDPVEIAIEVQGIEMPGAAVAIPPSAEAPSGPTTEAAQVPATRAVVARRDPKLTTPVALEGSAQVAGDRASGALSNAGGLFSTDASTDASASVPVDRFATFRPAHPNLYGPMGLPAPEEKARDLLAAPTMKQRGPSVEQPKARIVQGPGDVSADIAEDGTIQFRTPGTVRRNKWPLHTFSDGLDDGSGQPRDPQGLAKRRTPFLATDEGLRAGISGRMDVTDMVMKIAGQDPHASAKRALAEQTREERQCMAKRVRGERLKEALLTLADKVRHLATRVDLSVSQRRQLVFDIWDECSEESDSTDYGAMARATVLSIVREVFPAGSDKAYPAAELLAFNGKRSSRQRFAPYDPSPLPRQPDGGAPME